MFGKDFLWGVACAATQCEGAAYEDGKGLTVWDVYGKENKIFKGQTADVACDSYHRYKEDIKLMKKLGVKVYRLSFSWARIIPNGYDGKVNQKGIKHYQKVIDEILKAGLIPFVTLFHWDLPYEVYKKGGWSNREIVDWFGQYVKVVADNFSDKVKNWIPINEPECVLGGLGGTDRYGKYSTKEMLTMIHNLLLCHGTACKILREYDGVKIGTAMCGDGRVPASNKPEDIEAAYNSFFSIVPGTPWSVSIFSDPMILGKYPDEYYTRHAKIDLPDIQPGDMELINQPLDFYGFNNYTSWKTEADPNEILGYKNVHWGPNMIYTRGGTWPIVPEGMYWLLKFIYRRYNLPIIITENGTPSYDLVDDGKVHDGFRIKFLKDYLKAAEKAKDEGVPLVGYFIWSILDNLEWYDGYNERFGLIHVNFETLERTPKDSYYWFKNYIKNCK